MQIIDLLNTWTYIACAVVFVLVSYLARKKHGMFIANTLLNVMLFAIFIAVFFFTYAAQIEKKIVGDQMSYIAQSMVSDAALLPAPIVNALKSSMKVNDTQSMQQADADASESNKQLIKSTAIKIAIGCVIVGILIVFLVRGDEKENKEILKMIIQALIALAGIGVTEFLFLRYLVRYYRAGDPNFVKLQIAHNLQNI